MRTLGILLLLSIVFPIAWGFFGELWKDRRAIWDWVKSR